MRNRRLCCHVVMCITLCCAGEPPTDSAPKWARVCGCLAGTCRDPHVCCRVQDDSAVKAPTRACVVLRRWCGCPVHLWSAWFMSVCHHLGNLPNHISILKSFFEKKQCSIPNIEKSFQQIRKMMQHTEEEEKRVGPLAKSKVVSFALGTIRSKLKKWLQNPTMIKHGNTPPSHKKVWTKDRKSKAWVQH